MSIKETNGLIIAIYLFCITGCSNHDAIDKYFPVEQSQFSDINIDTLRNWKQDTLAITKQYFFSENWRIDDFVVFNKDSTLIYTTLNCRNAEWKHAEIDNILDIGGAKIDDKWYFYFMNVSMPVSRTRYKDSKYTPYTFKELSYIAHKHRYPQVVSWLDDGGYTVKEQYFKQKLFTPIKKRCNSEQEFNECFDSVIIQFNKEYHSRKIDPEELAQIKEAMDKSVKPLEPIKEKQKLSWWDRLRGEEGDVKLFESRAWKQYIANQ